MRKNAPLSHNATCGFVGTADRQPMVDMYIDNQIRASYAPGQHRVRMNRNWPENGSIFYSAAYDAARQQGGWSE